MLEMFPRAIPFADILIEDQRHNHSELHLVVWQRGAVPMVWTGNVNASRVPLFQPQICWIGFEDCRALKGKLFPNTNPVSPCVGLLTTFAGVNALMR